MELTRRKSHWYNSCYGQPNKTFHIENVKIIKLFLVLKQHYHSCQNFLSKENRGELEPLANSQQNPCQSWHQSYQWRLILEAATVQIKVHRSAVGSISAAAAVKSIQEPLVIPRAGGGEETMMSAETPLSGVGPTSLASTRRSDSAGLHRNPATMQRFNSKVIAMKGLSHI